MRILKLVLPTTILWLLLTPSSQGQVEAWWLKAKPNPVEVRFIKSAYADYMFYLLYRNSGNFKDLESAVPLGDIPQLDSLISLPEQLASAQATSYGKVYELAAQYRELTGRVLTERVKPPDRGWETRYKILVYSDDLPHYDTLMNILARGEADFPAFEKFWQEKIAPAEDQQIAVWQQQLTDCRPFDQLQQLLRIPFPFDKIDIAAIALHLSGSGSTDPAGIYTSLFPKPKLGWVIGHEGTHLSIDENAGANWQANPLASKAIELMKQRGGTASDIEEALPLLLQVKLSQTCGTTDLDYSPTAHMESSPKKEIVQEMERGWVKYRKNNYEENAIQFLLTSAIKALQAASSGGGAKPATP
ncbi:MAG: hypothetical protein ABSD20_09695 [Terriglobales bacterium]